jgi:hypothetical protein
LCTFQFFDYKKKKRYTNDDTEYVFKISDSGFGLLEYNQTDFIKFWIGNNADETTEKGIALLLDPTPKFFQSEFDKEDQKGLGFGLLSPICIAVQIFFSAIKHWLVSEQFVAAYFSFPDAKHCRCRDSKSEHSFYLFNPVCTIVSICWKNRVRTHPEFDIVTSFDKNKYLPDFGFFYQINEFADLLF